MQWPISHYGDTNETFPPHHATQNLYLSHTPHYALTLTISLVLNGFQ
jgi:hypothetical protein